MNETIATDTIEVARSGRGYAVEGPGYYVWDEDLDQVICAARDLQRGVLPAQTTRRMLVIRQARSVLPDDCEALDA